MEIIGYVATMRVAILVNQHMKMKGVRENYKTQVQREIKALTEAEDAMVKS